MHRNTWSGMVRFAMVWLTQNSPYFDDSEKKTEDMFSKFIKNLRTKFPKMYLKPIEWGFHLVWAARLAGGTVGGNIGTHI